METVIIDRQFSWPYSDQALINSKHRFVLGGVNDRRERLAMAIAKAGTALAYQPRARATQAIEQMAITGKNYAVVERALINYHHDVYVIHSNGRVDTIALDVTAHRACVIRCEYDNREQYDGDVWQNYCTNGYTTRIGLKRANACATKVSRIKTIARSHAEYDDQIYTGEEGHNLRASIR